MDMPAQIGDNAEGVRVAGRILTAARNARWPMYLRNVKQILRQTEGGFDERRYGFGGLMDLLKACQREGFVRIERDRRGGLRVFQGRSCKARRPWSGSRFFRSRTSKTHTSRSRSKSGRATRRRRTNCRRSRSPRRSRILIDTTAELLGRAKPRPRRAPAAARADGSASRRPRPQESRRLVARRVEESASSSERGRQLTRRDSTAGLLPPLVLQIIHPLLDERQLRPLAFA